MSTVSTVAIEQRPLNPDAVIVQVEPATVSLEQASQMMAGADPKTLRKWMDRAGFPYIRIGRRVIVPVAEMRQWVTDNVGKTIEV